MINKQNRADFSWQSYFLEPKSFPYSATATFNRENVQQRMFLRTCRMGNCKVQPQTVLWMNRNTETKLKVRGTHSDAIMSYCSVASVKRTEAVSGCVSTCWFVLFCFACFLDEVGLWVKLTLKGNQVSGLVLPQPSSLTSAMAPAVSHFPSSSMREAAHSPGWELREHMASPSVSIPWKWRVILNETIMTLPGVP